MMKRVIATLFFLFLLLCAAVLVAPGFIDWNRHKDTLAAYASAYMQRDVKISGDISFRVLPDPQLSVSGVTVASVTGARQPHFLKLRQLDAKVRLRPLLEGRIEVEKIHLVKPELTLEVLDNSGASWQGLMPPGAAEGKTPAFLRQAGAVRLEDVTLSDGRIRYLHAASGVDVDFDSLNLAIGAPSLQGPYKIAGDMRFRDIPVNIEITAGQAVAGASPGVALDALFQPLDRLPQLRFKGVAGGDGGGAFFEGDVLMEQGSPAALFTQDFLTVPVFLREEMRLAAALSLRAGELSLRKISAQYTKTKKGRLGGDVILRRPSMEMPVLDVDLQLAHLSIGDGQGRIPLPQGMRASVSLRGEEAVWRGMPVRRFDLKAESGQDAWTIHSLRAELDQKTVLTARGSSRPAQQADSLRLTLKTDDIAAMAKACAAVLPEKAVQFLSSLPPQGVEVEGNLDMRPDRASLYNFTADFAGGGKASGVINLPARGMEARMNLAGMILSDQNDEQRALMARHIFAPDTLIDITAEGQEFSGISLDKVVLKAETDNDGAVTVSQFSGEIGKGGRFSMQGGFSSWPPESARRARIDYDVEMDDLAALGRALGFVWPRPLHVAAPAHLRGSWSGDGGYKVAGAFHGGTVDLQKEAQQPAARLSLSFPDSHGVLALFGIGIDRLVSPAGPVRMTAELSEAQETFRLEGLQLSVKESVATGRAGKRESGFYADVRSDNVQFDRWLDSGFRQAEPLSLTLHAKKAQVRGVTLQRMDSEMDITEKTVEVKSLKAGLWGGMLAARAKLLRRDDKTWTAETSGEIAALQPAQMPVAFPGLIADEGGNLSFSFSAKARDKVLFRDVEGAFSLSLPVLEVAGFDPAALAAYLSEPESGAAAEDPAAAALKILRGGTARYRDVNAGFTRKGDVIGIKDLSLQNAASSLKVDATLDVSAAKYELEAFATLREIDGLEPLVLTRAGAVASAPAYRLSSRVLSDYVTRRRQPVQDAAQPAHDMPVLEGDAVMLPPGDLSIPDVATETPGEILPVEEEALPQPEIPLPQGGDAIQGILQRLGE
jgi:hypothetical protein